MRTVADPFDLHRVDAHLPGFGKPFGGDARKPAGCVDHGRSFARRRWKPQSATVAATQLPWKPNGTRGRCTLAIGSALIDAAS